jgi:ATP-binding cassette subfamily F protein 3
VVRGLSGGERSRLALAKMMLFPRNVLALDEPTNHLDIPARETLEEALDGFPGTLLVVSHDRYFLDRVCRKLLVVEGEGLESHLGNWSDYRSRQRQSARAAARVPEPPPAPANSAAETARAANKDRERQRRKLERRVETAEAEVARLEGELRALRAELAADHQGDWQKLHALADRERDLDERLARRMAEWETAADALAAAPQAEKEENAEKDEAP